MGAGPVERWFGAAFERLHPQLQALHAQGGVLIGPCEVSYGTGLARLAGKLLAWKLGIGGTHAAPSLTVTVSSDANGLWWRRQFNDGKVFTSRFEPVGNYPDGHWIERSGTLQLQLGVRIHQGAWHWEQQQLRWRGWILPAPCMPRTTASKNVSDGHYIFSVAIAFPVLGTVLAYCGVLT